MNGATIIFIQYWKMNSVNQNRKMLKKYLLLIIAVINYSQSHAQTNDLYETVLKLDSTFFLAYNTCDIQKQEAFYSDSIEFYHDKSGLSTSKKEILENTKKYICGKVTRELVKGSVEVSPIPGYGAIELGSHMFHNDQEKDAVSHPSKFVIVWRNNNSKWSITKVISLH